jgi:hypothetical protein
VFYVRFVVSGEFDQALARLRADVDELLCADVSGLEEASLVQALRDFEGQRRRLEAVEHRLVKQANDTHLPSSCATRTVAGVLSQVLRIDVREARLRENRALDCGPRATLTGAPLEPVLPLVAAAVAAGEISPAQVDVIVEAMAKIPESAPTQAWPVVEGVLVEAARHEAPRLLRRTAHELLTRLDPEDVEERERWRERERGFTLSPLGNGWARASGRLDPRLTAQLQAVLDALAKPRPAEDGTPDPRSPEQRRHDGLAEAIGWVLRSDQQPDNAGGHAPVSVLATTTIEDLTRAAAGVKDHPPVDLTELAADRGIDLAELLATSSSGLATLSHGQAISAASLLAWACEAEVVPVVFNAAGGVLSYGRTRRYATPGQRLALAARDRGCSFPGCDRPPAWCEAHHVLEWIKDGPTDLDNLCLLCSWHHRNFAHAGWRAFIDDGVVWWIPPAWEGPDQTPRRNTVHHLEKILFRQPEAA